MKFKLLLFSLCLALFVGSIKSQATAKITPSHTLTIEVIDNENLKFTVRNLGSKQGWVGIGYGGHLMENTDYHIFVWLGGFNYYDSWSDEQDDPSQDFILGGQMDLTDVTETVDGNDSVVTYYRKVNTGDRYDYQFVNGDNNLQIAWWDEEDVGDHGSLAKTGNIFIDFNTKEVRVQPTFYIVWEVHGIAMLVAWCILNSIGYITGRLFKHVKLFKWIHAFTSGTCGLLNLVFGIVGLASGISGGGGLAGALTGLHLAIGLLVIVIGTLTHLTGSAQWYLIWNENLKSNLLLKLKVLHKFMAIAISYIQLICIITGGFLLYQD